MTLTEDILSKLTGDMLGNLRRTDAYWKALRENTLPVPTVVTESLEPLSEVEWDVVICGGTLGIVMACALVHQGWRVALLERGQLQGREQEWNISRRELRVLHAMGLLTEAQVEQAIATEYNPARIAFHNGVELWVEDVLNIGVDPRYLLEMLKQSFLAKGGQLLEHTPFEAVTVHPNGVQLKGAVPITARLLLDAMGHLSPISQQARGGARPDAVCLVVGTCATGFPKNDTGDLFVTVTPMTEQRQYFWEAFPARDGRTTYLFTYLDAHPDRPSLEQLFEDYLTLMPEYQGVALDQLQVKRALFGVFPCYRKSPLQSAWARILPIGDSSGSQSPLSFGGFGAMIRHLQRLTEGIHQALEADLLDRPALQQLQPYQPSLSVTWLFQRSMSIGVAQSVPPEQINQLLSAVFQEMQALGDPVLKPFLQDVVQFPALLQTLARTTVFHPGLVARIVPQVGLGALVSWLSHYAALGAYAGLYPLTQTIIPLTPKLPPALRYNTQRWIDAIAYGSGNDYQH